MISKVTNIHAQCRRNGWGRRRCAPCNGLLSPDLSDPIRQLSWFPKRRQNAGKPCLIARAAILGLSLLLPLTVANQANALCRQALAIGLDISGSVDAKEYRLQLDGLAGALLDGEVQDAFLAMPDAWVRLFIYEWGGFGTQRPIVGWKEIASRADLRAIAAVLVATRRAPHDLSTALGKSMLYGGTALIEQSDCWRATLDLSGDGKSNIGPQPTDIGGDPVLAGITINALVIGADAPPYSDISQSEIAELSSYFRSQVIRGPDAFVETAIEFENFQDAMARKLLKELQTRAVGALVPPVQ